MNIYQQKANAERLAAQAAPVQKIAKAILEQLKTLENQLYWALDPDDAEREGGSYWLTSLIEHTHALIDLGHDYRAAVLANPPPEEDDEDAA